MPYFTIMENIRRYELLRRIYVRSRARDVEMHRGQVPLLDFIVRHDGCTQAEAAEYTGVSSASVALSAKRMAAAGLIERNADAGDLRLNRLSATEKGRRAQADFMAVFAELDERTFRGFSQEELAQLNAFLERMIENVAPEHALGNMDALVRQLHTMDEGHNA